MSKHQPHATEIPLSAAQLVWHQVRLMLTPHHPGRRTSHPLVVLRGLIKSVGGRYQPPPLAFHVPDYRVRELPKLFGSGEPVALDILLFTAEPTRVAAWVEALREHLRSDPRANHELTAEPAIERCCFQPQFLASETTAMELEFLTPLPFRPNRGGPPTALSLERFLSALQTRVHGLFGQTLALPDLRGISIQAEYWGYHKIDAPSHSQPGHNEWLHGGLGPIWFRGTLGPIVPWLELAEAIHAGGKRELNPLGYCRLHRAPRPHLDPLLGRANLYRKTLERLTSKSEADNAGLALLLPPRGDGRGRTDPCRVLAESVAAGRWEPAPAQVFPIPKHHEVRWAERFEPQTQLVLALLHGLLQEPFERMFSPVSFGFRPGRSVNSAMEQVRQAIADGYRYIVRTDVEDCFGAIDLDRLEAKLDERLPPGDTRLRELLHQLLRAPMRKNDLLVPRLRGIAQGSPLSPLLANLFLDAFDRALADAPGRLVRFADDIALLARTREDADQLLSLAEQALIALGLRIHRGKTQITEAEAGFTFLGQAVDAEAPSTLSGPHRLPLRKNLYVTEIGAYLGNNGDAVEIRRRGQPVEVIPLRRLAGIVLLAPGSLSTGLIGRCARMGVPITIAPGGRVSALVAPATRGFLETSAEQSLQWQALGVNGRLDIARQLAEAKLMAYQHLLRQRYAPGANKLLRFIDERIAALNTAADTNAIRGLEGAAAARIQRAIDGFIRVPEFHFARRDRHEPDRMNPLFNMAYHLLFGRISALLRSAGLNPWLGYLHDAGDVYESLTCDLQEPFRAPVDRMLLALVNRREIKADQFSKEARGMRIAPEAIRTIAAGFETMLHDARQQPTLARAIDAQVEAVRRHALGREAFWVYRWGEDANQASAEAPTEDTLE